MRGLLLHTLFCRYISTKVYNATCKEELNFGARDFMHVLHKKDGWLHARLVKTGREGLVPSDCAMKFKPLEEEE